MGGESRSGGREGEGEEKEEKEEGEWSGVWVNQEQGMGKVDERGERGQSRERIVERAVSTVRSVLGLERYN